jgi:hypothetical protein
MAGDYSRVATGVFERYCAVLKQQGRVEIDSDWNAEIAEITRRWTTQAADTFGPAAVPAQTTPNGFLVSGIGGSATDFSIGAGRIYVDGIQAEIFAGETFNGAAISYLNQPYFPAPPALAHGAGLVYLDVWEREVTAIQDPHLLDVALGGVDTTTRLQTVWQVKVLPASGDPQQPALSCGMDLSALFPASAGRISTRATNPVAPTDPCILPDEGGYRGIENRLYRVEIHKGGDAGAARWKWSRDNASVVSRVTAISNGAAGAVLTVDRIGRDNVLRFSANDWVELTDDNHELLGVPGFIAQITGAPDEGALKITLGGSVPATAPGFDLTDPASRHTRLIRWNQRDGVGADGLLPVAPGWVKIDDGVEIRLAIDAAAPGGKFHAGDYWCFEARVADASVRELKGAPPLGIRHHYCTLATFDLSAGAPVKPSGCRVLWPPPVLPTGEDGCACTVCVSAAGHNGGTATIAMAVAQVSGFGGRICLGPGIFNLGATPLGLDGLRNITLMGQGPATVLLYGGAGAAVEIFDSMDVRLQDVTIFAFAADAATDVAAVVGVYLRNCLAIVIERCGVVAASLTAKAEALWAPGTATGVSAAVAFDGFILETTLRDNIFLGEIGLCKGGALKFAAAKAEIKGASPETKHREILILADFIVSENLMICGKAGIAFFDASLLTGLTVYGLKVVFEGNRIDGAQFCGALVEGFPLPHADLQFSRNALNITGGGIACAADAMTIADNFVTQTGAPAGNSDAAPAAITVRSIPGSKLPIVQSRILRNRIAAFAGSGVEVSGLVRSSTIADNSIVNVTTRGISVTGGAETYETIIRGNEVYVVSAPAQGTGAQSADMGATFKPVDANALWKFVKTDAPFVGPVVAGIYVASAPLATIAGNSVAVIGAESGSVAEFNGVYLAEVASAGVSDNRIGDIGSAQQPGLRCYGVQVLNTDKLIARSGRSDITVRGNEIQLASVWSDQPRRFTGVSVHSLAPDSLVITTSIADNCVSGNSVAPLVVAVSKGQALFNGNRCGKTSEKAPSVVEIAAATIICSANRVESASEAPAMVLEANVVQNTTWATVLGNIVKGKITMNGQQLPATWIPLNIEL